MTGKPALTAGDLFRGVIWFTGRTIFTGSAGGTDCLTNFMKTGFCKGGKAMTGLPYAVESEEVLSAILAEMEAYKKKRRSR